MPYNLGKQGERKMKELVTPLTRELVSKAIREVSLSNNIVRQNDITFIFALAQISCMIMLAISGMTGWLLALQATCVVLIIWLSRYNVLILFSTGTLRGLIATSEEDTKRDEDGNILLHEVSDETLSTALVFILDAIGMSRSIYGNSARTILVIASLISAYVMLVTTGGATHVTLSLATTLLPIMTLVLISLVKSSFGEISELDE